MRQRGLRSNAGLLLVLIGALLASSAASGAAGWQKPKERFDPDGSFWFQGKPPKEFENIGGINLNSKRSRRLPAAGVELVNGKRLNFKSLSVKRESLIFSTVPLGGTSYSFSGRFLKGGIFSAGDFDSEDPVLEGTLTKWNGSKKVAESTLKFTYFGGT